MDELSEADEVFCTGTAVGVAPVGSITCHGKRCYYRIIQIIIFKKEQKIIKFTLKRKKIGNLAHAALQNRVTYGKVHVGIFLTCFSSCNWLICRMEYKTGAQTVCTQLYSTLVGIQTGHIEDKKAWIVEIE